MLDDFTVAEDISDAVLEYLEGARLRAFFPDFVLSTLGMMASR